MKKTNETEKSAIQSATPHHQGLADHGQEPLPGRTPSKAFMTALDAVRKMGRKKK